MKALWFSNFTTLQNYSELSLRRTLSGPVLAVHFRGVSESLVTDKHTKFGWVGSS